ncbi:Ig domain-containing protein [Eggerthella sp. YY7918]|uniref:Ig domain-containing protein n=1 Tax=Eggerthella sp. (strain YY7918) TaxID=502558 RepID=UPI0002171245|nr:Ig domain-containing protein [Eggerthella sp. YY7918]BAK44174.1 hypothetical protein EGYY_09920 [Eggerthella sp. YY7918]
MSGTKLAAGLTGLLLTGACAICALCAAPSVAEAATVGDLTIVRTADGSDPIPGVDYEYDDFSRSLNILSNTPMTISGSTTEDCIGVEHYTDANLTFENLTIDVQMPAYFSAVALGSTAADGDCSLTLTVVGDNLLRTQFGNGIFVPSYSELTISDASTGKLEVYGEPGDRTNPTPGRAALGGSNNGPITINGGTIIAHGGNSSAGIGGNARGNGQDITINGGNVTATSAGSAAGIGGGGVYSFAYRIAINGGVVHATGGMMGAGIGSGAIGEADGITITGGEVYAYGGSLGAAGIGGGTLGNLANFKVTGGTIHAEGSIDPDYGEAAGIGSGVSSRGGSSGNAVEPPAGYSALIEGILGGGTVLATAAQPYMFDETDRVADITFAPQLAVDGRALPQAQVGSAYQATLNAVGGASPYTWTVATGTLPDGLVLDPSTGIITGTPTQAGTATFTVTATDAWGVSASTEKTILVTPPQSSNDGIDSKKMALANTGDGGLAGTSAGLIGLVAVAIALVGLSVAQRKTRH